MPQSGRASSDRLVLAPREPLVGGGAAEAFERHLRQLYQTGHRNVIVDLAGVPQIDSAGIRALVRGHTTAGRMSGTMRLAGLRPDVLKVVEVTHLRSVFDIYESVDAARMAALPWRTIRVGVAGAVLCGALVWAGLRWPVELTGVGEAAEQLMSGRRVGGAVPFHVFQPFLELL